MLAFPSQSVFCGATFTMRDPSQTVQNIEADNHTHLLFLDCMRFDVRAHAVVAIKLYAKLEYIPHDSSVVPASDDRPIAHVLL